ncbi:uncharacterized protein [Macrobrachium rosenbergii]|uniref:uncharacterized protein n=1 Tax=Macrobrachium rosenbergii TaxID=79674 RepID=UPI0034D62115
MELCNRKDESPFLYLIYPISKMFSKVFKVEKKSRELQNAPRPSSTEQRPTYYPLLQSSLHGNRKRATVHDTRASSIEKDLDLLELVCRSDSLHKRLDELQAKYERMDDGMEHISRETRIKESKSEKRNRQKSNLLPSTRISKSFEEPEVKKPSFFKRIFGNRLSKSEDDLLDKGTPEQSADVKENGTPIATPPLKDRRSASADILSIKDLVVRPPDKRHSCSVEFADLRDRDPLDDCLMPPPPPPPPDLNFIKGGMKRKRVIKMYNIDPLDKQNSSMGGSSESCYDSTDSELDVRTRRASDSYHRPNHIYPPAPAGETQHCRHHSLQNALQPLQQQQQQQQQQQHSHVHDGMIGGDPASYSQYDLINTSGRSSRSSCYKQTPLVSLPPGKMPQEGEWPRNEDERMRCLRTSLGRTTPSPVPAHSLHALFARPSCSHSHP